MLFFSATLSRRQPASVAFSIWVPSLSTEVRKRVPEALRLAFKARLATDHAFGEKILPGEMYEVLPTA